MCTSHHMTYRKSGNFRCQNIFMVAINHENKKNEIILTTKKRSKAILYAACERMCIHMYVYVYCIHVYIHMYIYVYCIHVYTYSLIAAVANRV